MQEEINIEDYRYELPHDRIALYPLPERDQSKLLVYKNGGITHTAFSSIVDYLPSNSTLFFNNTRVIPARLFFHKDTGAVIEIFLLNPISPSSLVPIAMNAHGNAVWQCTIGNLKRWAEGTELRKGTGTAALTVKLVDKASGKVEFNWEPASLSFAEVISASGVTPLPPYLKREAENSDRERYQTVYSREDGAVAAPTAGLHFTDSVLQRLRDKGIETNFLTLHVSAGTFMPVKEQNALRHIMHAEQVVVTRENIMALLQQRTPVAVGTTSVRTLESTYWYGVKLLDDPNAPFVIHQYDAYQLRQDVSPKQALEAVLQKMAQEATNTLMGETSIYIVPGYAFKICRLLVTNFHQPGSTLMLLVAAFIGADWRKVYQGALDNSYRFLSYGDSSLLFLKEAGG